MKMRCNDFLLATVLITVSVGSPLSAADRSHGRSMVISRNGIVATSHTLASQAGAQILARGGSAVDAAIAANAVLGVVEPMMCGIGGDLFVIYWEAATGKLYGLNASGWAPTKLTREFLIGQGLEKMPSKGIHSATVPGSVRGWEALHRRFGRAEWKDLFGASIHYSGEGFPVTESISSAWGGDAVSANERSRRVFLQGKKGPGVGEIFRNPGLSHAMTLIAEHGADAFYEGEIADAIVRTSRGLGGTMGKADLAEWQPEWVEPISSDYRGWTVYELPPNVQGMAALQILNILSESKAAPGGPQSFRELHKKIEATKLAYADLRAFVADPRFADVPVTELLSAKYSALRASLIDPAKADCGVKPGAPKASDTTYLSVVDRDGNIASWIQSVSGGWGSGVVVDGMGFHLQNRGGLFTLDADHPNVLAARKRPFHTIIPGFMQKRDQHIGFGIMGGPNQPQAHVQFVSNMVDYGMNIQEALSAPRFRQSNEANCEVELESRLPGKVVQQLSEAGHRLKLRREYSSYMGRGNAVLHDSSSEVNFGASGPRADGEAIPEPLP